MTLRPEQRPNSIIDQRRQDNALTGTLPTVPPPPPQTTYLLNPGNPAKGDRCGFFAVYPDMPLLSYQYPVSIGGFPANGSDGYFRARTRSEGGVIAAPSSCSRADGR